MRVGLPAPVSVCRDHETLIPRASEIKMNRVTNLYTLKGVALKLHGIGMCFSTALRISRVNGIAKLRLTQRCR